jgi:hypothetical protein
MSTTFKEIGIRVRQLLSSHYQIQYTGSGNSGLITRAEATGGTAIAAIAEKCSAYRSGAGWTFTHVFCFFPSALNVPAGDGPATIQTQLHPGVTGGLFHGSLEAAFDKSGDYTIFKSWLLASPYNAAYAWNNHPPQVAATEQTLWTAAYADIAHPDDSAPFVIEANGGMVFRINYPIPADTDIWGVELGVATYWGATSGGHLASFAGSSSFSAVGPFSLLGVCGGVSVGHLWPTPMLIKYDADVFPDMEAWHL